MTDTYGGIPCNGKSANQEPGTWLVWDDARDMTEAERTSVSKWYKGWLLEHGVVPCVIKSREDLMKEYPPSIPLPRE